jgi:glycosyltransferase involved in cell wall biosynthesis
VSIQVVHLCKAFSRLSETFIYDYVMELERQGGANAVVTNQRENAEERPFDHVKVVPWPSVWHPRRCGYRLLEVLGMERRLNSSWRELWPGAQAAVRQMRPHLLHAHFGRSGVKAVPIAKELGLPLVVSFYGYDISELPKAEGWRRAYRRIWETAQAIVVLSEDMKQRALRLGAPAEKVHVVHLARNLDDFSYRRPRPPLSRFVTVGRLTEKKGHFDAIRAVKKHVDQGRELHLQIVGGGPLHDDLSRFIRAKGMEDHVDLLGARSNEEVAEILRAADAFLLCSKVSPSGDREGTPTVLIEAQAVGLPCVSTTHAGIPEMIPERNHRFLAEEGDVDEIAACIRRLLACSDDELGAVAEAGREKIEHDFNLVREAETLRTIYQDVSALPAPSP